MQSGFDSDLLQITVFLPETFTGLDSRCVPPAQFEQDTLSMT